MIDSPGTLEVPPFDIDEESDDRFNAETIERDDLSKLDDDTSLFLNSPLAENVSGTFVGNWNKLVSQTNWEKGSVILRWREAMQAADMPRLSYSDEAWARRVGNVSSQHIGRLRRVAERFERTAQDYPKLFWSHFQAALDWEDAETWLEGAVQNNWSVAQMRVHRWEAIGAPAELKPLPEDVFFAELDEDVNPRNDSNAVVGAVSGTTEAKIAEIGSADMIEGFDSSDPAFGQDGEMSEKASKKDKNQNSADGPSTIDLLSGTLKDFSEFPDDLSEALETLKVAILNHKLAGWKDCPLPQLVKKIEALKELLTSSE